MKKIYLIMFALFCATAIFTGCSDDDEDGKGNEKGNGNGAGNGGTGVTVLSKKISKIVLTENGVVEETYSYTYDSEGRLSTIKEEWGKGPITSSITYATDKITITRDNNPMDIIVLKNGRATTGTFHDGNDYIFNYSMEYTSDGYLSKMTYHEDQKTNDQWESDPSIVSNYKINGGNLQSVTSTGENGVSLTLEYGNVANNTNIDLWEFISGYDNMNLLCVMGTRYKNLPSKLTGTYTEDESLVSYVSTYTYEVDKDNYVTKITEVSVSQEGENEETRTYTGTYTITYE